MNFYKHIFYYPIEGGEGNGYTGGSDAPPTVLPHEIYYEKGSGYDAMGNVISVDGISGGLSGNTFFKVNIPSDNVDISTVLLRTGGIKTTEQITYPVAGQYTDGKFTSTISGDLHVNVFSEIIKYTVTAKDDYSFLGKPKLKISNNGSDYSIRTHDLVYTENNTLTSVSFTVNYKPRGVKVLTADEIDIKLQVNAPKITATTNPVTGEQIPVKKEIKSVTVENEKKYIPQGGQQRVVAITGSGGSKFSLTIKDSSDCSILKEELENVSIPKNGTYRLYQDFPSIQTKGGVRATKETYTIKITPQADVEMDRDEIKDIVVYQYADPTITFAHTDTVDDVAMSALAITKSGRAGENSKNIPNYSSSTHTLTATPDGSGAKVYVLDNFNFLDNVVSNTINKRVIDRCDQTGPTRELILKPAPQLSTGSVVAASYTDDIVAGMTVKATITKTKTVKTGLETTDCNKATNKFELNHTHGLTVGMEVSGHSIIANTLESIDCDKNITLTVDEVLRKETVLTFKQDYFARVNTVKTNDTGHGTASIVIDRALDIPHNTELTFEDNETIVNGRISATGSGTTSVTLTTEFDVVKFGKKDATYTLNLTNILSSKPNAYDYDVVVSGGKATTISMISKDRDDNATSKTGTVVRSPQHGAISAYGASTDEFQYTPHTGFVGEDYFTYTMSDGSVSSAEKTVRITVSGASTTPATH